MISEDMQALYAMLDCVPTPIFVLDVTQGDVPVYAHYNRSALRRLGRELADIVGKTTVEAFGVEYGTQAYEEQRKTILSGKQRKYEFQLPIDEEVRVVRTTLFPQKDAQGHVIRLIGSAQDVSMEWIAQRAQSKLDTIGTEVEQFVAMAAHDLRTPMRNVMYLSEMLSEDFEDHGDGKVELVRLLKETSEKSMALITDVLSYASTLGPAQPPVLYSLGALCTDVMSAIDPQSNHTLHATDLTLLGEKSVMQIVLRNLIDNAIKHGKCPHMTLFCDARMQGDTLVQITLRDNGAGFDNPGTVFLDSGEFKVDSGYGLLAIRKLIRARGGNISATNDPVTGGSSVTFSLPDGALSHSSDRRSLPMAENIPTALRKTG